MPNDLRLQAAQAYIEQPAIHTGYKASSGGLGTVNAIVNEHPIEIAQAQSSTTNRKRLEIQSSLIQVKIGPNTSVILHHPRHRMSLRASYGNSQSNWQILQFQMGCQQSNLNHQGHIHRSLHRLR